MNSHAHRLPKNSNPVVDAAGCGNPFSVEPTGSKATKQVPLDSYPVSPKAKLDSVVLPVPTSGLHGGLEDHSSNSDSCVLHQTDACAAPVNNSSSGHYHLKPNGGVRVCWSETGPEGMLGCDLVGRCCRFAAYAEWFCHDDWSGDSAEVAAGMSESLKEMQGLGRLMRGAISCILISCSPTSSAILPD
ncbi:hypothetical protein Nepgr_026611 [Nepenthes gracilis]|uniref:Uncharacterized protein n=1 Tax=Nepenthes gracilis TaxID=150966 RepID=A0AAD3T7I8_NEPGR|nr:hypothetical protein Nepgr_026611 [Nepenthes gracilis]